MFNDNSFYKQFKTLSSWHFRYPLSRKPGEDQAVTASAEEPPIIIHTSGVTNNWCGRTEARQASEGAGKRIMSRPADRTRYLTARSFAANATPEQDRMEDHREKRNHLISAQGWTL